MRYHSEEEDRLFKIYEPYLKVDSKVFFYLPDTAPEEAKDAQKKVKKFSLIGKWKNRDFLKFIKSTR